MRHADDYGHHIQPVAYKSAVAKLRPQLAGRVEFLFAFMELDAPYVAVPRTPGVMSTWVGEQQWRRAIRIWETCLRTGIWPAYPPEPLDVAPWTYSREEELADQELLASAQ
jgi:hypothetical protein